MGILSESSYNLTFGIKLEHLRNLILAGTNQNKNYGGLPSVPIMNF